MSGPGDAPEPVVRMWEARVEPGRLDDAARWVVEVAAPGLRSGGATRTEAFASAAPEERVVCVSWWSGAAGPDPLPPPGLLARAHGWDFRPLAPA